MPLCLKCQSQRVIAGTVVTPSGTGLVIFRPQGLKFFSFSALGGTEVAEAGSACLDCGLVWSFTPPERLAAFVEKHCNPPASAASGSGPE